MSNMNLFRKYPVYKDSGVDWLGDTPDGWEVKKLKYVVEIIKRISGKLGYDVLSITQKGIKVKDVLSCRSLDFI